MNKKELIEKYAKFEEEVRKQGWNIEDLGSFGRGELAGESQLVSMLLNDLKQLDEPKKVVVSKMEKVVIPQFVAGWIEYQKTNRNPLLWAVSEGSKREAIADWLFPDNYREKVNREDLLLRAWIDGYAVEKEKLYYVALPYIGYMTNDKDQPFVDYKEDAAKSTEQEIKAIDERYWAFAEEVTE